MNGQAQWTEERSHLYDGENLKNYATANLQGSDTYIMAGTMFNLGGVVNQNGVHLLMLDATGNTVQNNVFDESSLDERAVDAHYVATNDLAIVASINNLTSTRPGVAVMRADGNGTLLSNNPIYSSDPDYPYIYPMGSLLYDANSLLICGYMTKTLPTATVNGFQTDKQAFVLYYNLSTDAVVMIKRFQTGTYTPSVNDYDIAYRMKKMPSLGPAGGDIWVGGMCQDGTTQSMLNMSLDFAGGALTLMHTKPIHKPSNNISPGDGEFSYDIVEDATGSGYYIFGNIFSPFVDANYHIYPQALFPTFAGVNNSLDRLAGASAHWTNLDFDYAWGINTVRGNNTNSWFVCGYARNRHCNSTPATHPSNINPFLAEYRIITSGIDIVVTRSYWNTILSDAGTGNTIFPNSFFNLGDGGSNMTFAPTLAVRDPSVSDIVLSAPVWNTLTNNNLGMKYIRTDYKAELTNCPWDKDCYVKYIAGRMTAGNTISETVTNVNQPPRTYNYFSYWQDHYLDCFVPYNKPARSQNVPYTNRPVSKDLSDISMTVSPNPAREQFNITFSGVTQINDLDVTVHIVDILGRVVEVPHNGRLSAFILPITLVNVPKGIYAVRVLMKGRAIKNLPLTVM